MKINKQFDIVDAISLLDQKPRILPEIEKIFSDCDLAFGKNRPDQIKRALAIEFNRLGWADRVPIQKDQNLTISFLKNRVGICIQFGNVARTYSDVLKLTFLTKKNIIDLGIIIVPNATESKLLGANYSSFARLSREIEIFSEIIGTPLVIFGVSN